MEEDGVVQLDSSDSDSEGTFTAFVVNGVNLSYFSFEQWVYIQN